MGNVQNRVYESAGPEGKVRGTPQQIIEKYMILARDAQTSGDRVTAENFLQHAEHYVRLLNASQGPGEERRPLPAFGMQARADYDDLEDQEEDAADSAADNRPAEAREAEARNGDGGNGEQRDGGRGERRERGERRHDERRPDDRRREDRRPDERRAEDRRPDDRRSDDRRGADRGDDGRRAALVEEAAELPAFITAEQAGAGLETIDAAGDGDEVGLVATPESREPEPEVREAAPRRRRRRAPTTGESPAVAETAVEG